MRAGTRVFAATLGLAIAAACGGGEVRTVGFGTGGSECELTGVASAFPVGTPVRYVVRFSPPLPVGSMVTLGMLENGVELPDETVNVSEEEPIPCLFGTLADMPAGRYSLVVSVDPSNLPATKADFEVTAP